MYYKTLPFTQNGPCQGANKNWHVENWNKWSRWFFKHHTITISKLNFDIKTNASKPEMFLIPVLSKSTGATHFFFKFSSSAISITPTCIHCIYNESSKQLFIIQVVFYFRHNSLAAITVMHWLNQDHLFIEWFCVQHKRWFIGNLARRSPCNAPTGHMKLAILWLVLQTDFAFKSLWAMMIFIRAFD